MPDSHGPSALAPNSVRAFLQEVELSQGAEPVTVSGGNDTDQGRTLVAVAHCL